MYLTENLRAFRKQLGFTQDDVAEFLSVAPQTVSKWERGETYPDITLLPALAHLYKTSVDALLGMDRLEMGYRQGEVYSNARAKLKNRDWRSAIQTYENALALWPGDQGITCDLAMALALSGDDLARAISLFKSILSSPVNNKLAQTARAALCYAYQKAGDEKAAAQTARQLPHMRESREIVQKNLADNVMEDSLNALIYELSTGERMV